MLPTVQGKSILVSWVSHPLLQWPGGPIFQILSSARWGLCQLRSWVNEKTYKKARSWLQGTIRGSAFQSVESILKTKTSFIPQREAYKIFVQQDFRIVEDQWTLGTSYSSSFCRECLLCSIIVWWVWGTHTISPFSSQFSGARVTICMSDTEAIMGFLKNSQLEAQSPWFDVTFKLPPLWRS